MVEKKVARDERLMAGSLDPTYRYLDAQEDREALIKDIQQVRQEVMRMSEIVPEEQWYEPRYHGWSLAAMLGHLQLMDRLNMWLIQAALLGLRPAISTTLVNQLNDFMARIYQRRLMEASLRGLERSQRRIEDFIMHLPVDRFTVQVFHPPSNKYLTVEQALQVLFLYHWQEHLKTMREAEGMSYQPPQDSTL